jgi:radical SAM superfamily enzyme YgiQ (UPF0313 family)
MNRGVIPLVSYAIQSQGPVLSGLMTDNGVALLAAELLHFGYKPRIFDYSNVNTIERIAKVGKEQFLKEVIEELDDYIKENGVKIIGFKLYANGFRDSVKIAKEIRERNRNLLIVGGGPQAYMFGHSIFGKIDIDEKVVHGSDIFNVLSYSDGTVAIVGLADVAYKEKNIADVPNLLLPDGDKTIRKYADLDRLPVPVYDREIYPSIDGKIFIPVVEDSRGCSHACTFCIHPRIGGKLRERSIEKIIEEMEYDRNKYGVTTFRLSGPSPSSKRINELCRQIPEGYKISAFGYSNPEYDFSGEVPKKLLGIFIGLESTDRRILEDVYKKTEDADRFLKNIDVMVQSFKKAGSATIVSMIVPSPDETDETMDKSIEYLLKVQPDFVPANPLGLMPGTPITRMVEKSSNKVGARVNSDFLSEMMKLELDLLQPPQYRPPFPYEIRVNGRFTKEMFSITGRFLGELAKNGIFQNSDEIVLMANLERGSLSSDQKERRSEVNEFMSTARQYIATSNIDGLREIVNRINRNQGIKNG